MRADVRVDEKTKKEYIAHGQMETFTRDGSKISSDGKPAEIYGFIATDKIFDTMREAQLYLNQKDPHWRTNRTRGIATFTSYEK